MIQHTKQIQAKRREAFRCMRFFPSQKDGQDTDRCHKKWLCLPPTQHRLGSVQVFLCHKVNLHTWVWVPQTSGGWQVPHSKGRSNLSSKPEVPTYLFFYGIHLSFYWLAMVFAEVFDFILFALVGCHRPIALLDSNRNRKYHVGDTKQYLQPLQI